MSDSLDLHNDAEKMAFNLRAKASMDTFLRSKSWVEKVKSIERMNVASRLAKAAMRKAQGLPGLEEVEGTDADSLID